MKNRRLLITGLLCLLLCSLSHGQAYRYSWKLDAPLLVGSFGFGLGATLSSSQVDPLTAAQIAALDPADVNGFDRFATSNWSTSAQHLSDVTMWAGIGSFLSLLGPQKSRSEFLGIGLMFLQGGFATTGVTNATKHLVQRTRPYVYNPVVPEAEKFQRDARFSFFSGHTSITTFGAFFTAKVLHDVFPDAKWRAATWAAAGLLSGTTGYLRIRGGKHYPTDILAGLAVGAGMGLLIPHIHKARQVGMSLYPAPNGMGVVFSF